MREHEPAPAPPRASGSTPRGEEHAMSPRIPATCGRSALERTGQRPRSRTASGRAGACARRCGRRGERHHRGPHARRRRADDHLVLEHGAGDVLAAPCLVGRADARTTDMAGLLPVPVEIPAIIAAPAPGCTAGGSGIRRFGRAAGGRRLHRAVLPQLRRPLPRDRFRHTAFDSALRSANRPGSSGVCTSTVAPQPNMLRQTPEMRRYIHIPIPGENRPARPSRGQSAQPVIHHGHRLNERQFRPILTRPNLGHAKNDVRNGNTADPSELVPSGNRIRLSPPLQHPRASRHAPCPVDARLRDTNTVRPSRAIVLMMGQPATSPLATNRPSNTPPITGTSTQEEWFDTIDHPPCPRAGLPRRPNDPHPDTDQTRERSPSTAARI